MLDDPAFAEAPELVRSLAEAGGEQVGEELNRCLQKELTFLASYGALFVTRLVE